MRILITVFFCFSSATWVSAQVVQLPTLRTFSLQTSVLVPDGGSTSLGSIRQNAFANTSRHPFGGRAMGSSSSTSLASASVQVIALEALDKAILQQTWYNNGATGDGNSVSASVSPQVNSHAPNDPRSQAFRSMTRPDYDYLSTMVHGENVNQPSTTQSQDTLYYLNQAKQAQAKGRWASVEVFYQLAWQSLPEKDRERVRKELIDKPASSRK